MVDARPSPVVVLTFDYTRKQLTRKSFRGTIPHVVGQTCQLRNDMKKHVRGESDVSICATTQTGLTGMGDG